MKAKEIIKHMDEQGLDLSFAAKTAKAERTSLKNYLKEFIKISFNAHGNTVNKVLNHFNIY